MAVFKRESLRKSEPHAKVSSEILIVFSGGWLGNGASEVVLVLPDSGLTCSTAGVCNMDELLDGDCSSWLLPWLRPLYIALAI